MDRLKNEITVIATEIMVARKRLIDCGLTAEDISDPDDYEVLDILNRIERKLSASLGVENS